MKSLIKLIFLAALSTSTAAMAHGEGHGKVDEKKVIQAAQNVAKKLTFKDNGMSVGKLDSSWNKVAKEQFELVEESDKAIIVKAINNANQQTLFFKVSKSGQVLDVKDANSFKNTHGHSR